MSRHDGTSAGAKSAGEARKPFVLEMFVERNMTYTPVKNGRFTSLDAAIAKAGFINGRTHVIEFGTGGKPKIVWES